jgi:hypothetical protein
MSDNTIKVDRPKAFDSVADVRSALKAGTRRESKRTEYDAADRVMSCRYAITIAENPTEAAAYAEALRETVADESARSKVSRWRVIGTAIVVEREAAHKAGKVGQTAPPGPIEAAYIAGKGVNVLAEMARAALNLKPRQTGPKGPKGPKAGADGTITVDPADYVEALRALLTAAMAADGVDPEAVRDNAIRIARETATTAITAKAVPAK